MPVPNTALALSVLEHVEANPEELDMGDWARRILLPENSCGTSYCFAGHAVHIAHPDAEFAFHEFDSQSEVASVVEVLGVGRRSIMDLAKELLGLTEDSADLLFSPSNTLEHLRDYVTQLCQPDFGGELACVNPLFDYDENDDQDDYYDEEDY